MRITSSPSNISMCAHHIPSARLCEQSVTGNTPTVTTPERLPLKSSRTPLKLTSNRMLYPLILTGECCVVTLPAFADFVYSDWVKLYLGTKNGTHVLGCMRLFLNLAFSVS